jgi:hypothetical protein
MGLGGESSPRKESLLRTLLATAVAVIIGLLLIAFTGGFEGATFRLILQNIGSFLVATVGLALLWELVTKQSLLQDIRTMFRLSESLYSSGISGFELADDSKWMLPVAHSKEVDILFGYHEEGSWPNTRTLEALFQRVPPGGRVRVVIPHPEEDAVRECLKARLTKDPHDIGRNLKNIRADLNKLPARFPAIHWDLRLVKQAPLISYIRCDGSANVLLCKLVRDQEQSPILRLQSSGELFDCFAGQFEALLNSEQVLPRKASSSLP